MSLHDSFKIDDKLTLLSGFPLAGKFVNDEIIGLHAFQPVLSSTADSPTKFADEADVNVFHLSQKFILDDPIVRSLITESNNIFYNLQNQKNRSNDSFLLCSRAYRSSIRTMLNKMQERIEEQHSEDDVKKYESFVTIFYSIECLWHLVEILLIDQISLSIVPSLIEWTKFHFPAASQNAAEMLIDRERDIDSLENYWPTVKTLVVQGQIDIARALLKLHSSSETMTYQLADKDLSAMPIYNSLYGGVSMQKFRAQFSYWSSNLSTRIDSGLYSNEPDLEEIMKLVVGDNESWREVSKKSSCWYEHFAGYLFFNYPAAKYFELGPFVDLWISQWVAVRGGSNVVLMKHLDRTVLSLMKNDIADFISLIQNVADNKWFVVHLVDLLVQSNQFTITDDEDNFKNARTMRESFITDYGTMLMSRGTMWQIGFEYLEFSSTEGMGTRELLLMRVPVVNDHQAMNLVSIAKRHGLIAVEQEICIVMFRKAMMSKRYGNALEWAIRSKDNIHVTNIANIFLEHYCKTGEMMHKNLLSQLGSKMLMFVAPTLLFLIKYFDFHMLYSSRQFSQAAELIVGLMDSQIIPNFAWPTLLADTIPLLENQEPIIPSKETYIIIRHIENDLIPLLETMQQDKDKNVENQLNLINGCPSELVQLLRLACARNLSRALMIENTL